MKKCNQTLFRQARSAPVTLSGAFRMVLASHPWPAWGPEHSARPWKNRMLENHKASGTRRSCCNWIYRYWRLCQRSCTRQPVDPSWKSGNATACRFKGISNPIGATSQDEARSARPNFRSSTVIRRLTWRFSALMSPLLSIT